MGWIHMETPKSEVHQCAKPKIPRNVEVGSIWQCDNCGKKWEVDIGSGVNWTQKYFTEAMPDIEDAFYQSRWR